MAAGDTLLVLFPTDAEAPGTGTAATLDVRNGVTVLDFSDSQDEVVEFAAYMPRHYGGGGLTVTVHWMASTATSGTVEWEMELKSVSDDADDLDSKSFAAANAVDGGSGATAASASGEVAYDTIGFTDGADMDSIAAGEYFRIRFGRDGGNDSGNDSMSGDAELVCIEIKEAA